MPDAVRRSSRCTLADIEACVSSSALRMGVEVQQFQSSDLALCIQRLQSAQEDAVVINPGR
jgi:3-dehydroquinate dehydratase